MADSEFALGPPQPGRGKSTFRSTAKYEATVIGAMALLLEDKYVGHSALSGLSYCRV